MSVEYGTETSLKIENKKIIRLCSGIFVVRTEILRLIS